MPCRVFLAMYRGCSPGLELVPFVSLRGRRDLQWTTRQASIFHIPGLHLPFVQQDRLRVKIAWLFLYFSSFTESGLQRKREEQLGLVALESERRSRAVAARELNGFNGESFEHRDVVSATILAPLRDQPSSQSSHPEPAVWEKLRACKAVTRTSMPNLSRAPGCERGFLLISLFLRCEHDISTPAYLILRLPPSLISENHLFANNSSAVGLSLGQVPDEIAVLIANLCGRRTLEKPPLLALLGDLDERF